MQHTSPYISKPVDKNGCVQYTDSENAVWQTLITRQQQIIQNRACDEFIHGLKQLNFSTNRIPQCPDISAILQETTGWQLEPVPALIPFDYFFELLANRKFPAATFIRRPEDLDYIEEPDIFHETFGHCPMLTNEACAEFMHAYGKLGQVASPQEQAQLAKLYWFTVEFGLLQTKSGLRAYGGGILSSKEETIYAVESAIPERKPFDIDEVLQVTYRIDELQKVYFVINDLSDLFRLLEIDLLKIIKK
jgi:phenylalanine-4-hydroxylase